MSHQNVNDKVANLWRHILWSMDNSKEDYSDADKRWLLDSIWLVIKFFQTANEFRNAGKQVNAKYIIEYLRNYNTVADCSRQFKIANVSTALLARVYNDVIKQEYFDVKKRQPFGVAECKE